MSRLRAYAQLVRLPNLPTAWADIGLGALALAVNPPAGLLEEGFPWLRFVLILVASSCLYMSGMIWNDWFDLEQDKRERPFRPLPSGRIRPAEAARAGAGLMLLGVATAFLASLPSFFLSLGLVAAIFAYD